MFCSGKISPKESALKKGDLKQLLIQLDQAVDVEGAMLAMIMLLQGTRIGETRKAKWREFNFQKRSWQIPILSTKTRVSLHLPMTQVLFNLVTAYRDYQIKKYGQVSTYLFPNKKHNRCLTETEANNLIQLVSGKQWQAHDLRKLFSSVNFSIGHDTTVIDLLTNHKIGVLHETYHDKEVQAVSKRDALVKYHAWLCSEDESQLMCVINARSHIAKFERQSNENKV
nr:tyrosine-type recombinase/integrase [Pseudoalteromonas sp. C2R02]